MVGAWGLGAWGVYHLLGPPRFPPLVELSAYSDCDCVLKSTPLRDFGNCFGRPHRVPDSLWTQVYGFAFYMGSWGLTKKSVEVRGLLSEKLRNFG
jgi:hypothetical protein